MLTQFSKSTLVFSSILALSSLVGCSSDSSVDAPAVDIFAGSTYSNCESNTQTSYAFGQNKNVTKTVQAYSDSNCITATGQPTEVEYTYALGAEITANDALKAQEFDLTEAGSGTTYTLVRLSGGLLGTDNLNFGATLPSSPGRDGSTSALRHDGVDLMTTYELQTTP